VEESEAAAVCAWMLRQNGALCALQQWFSLSSPKFFEKQLQSLMALGVTYDNENVVL